MNRVARLCVLASFVLLACAAPAFAQGRRGGGGGGEMPRPAENQPWRGKAEVSGKVLDDTGAGMGDVRITMVHVETNSGFFVTTKKKTGEFSAKDMKAGEWRVQVDAPDFVTLRQTGLTCAADERTSRVACSGDVVRTFPGTTPQR